MKLFIVFGLPLALFARAAADTQLKSKKSTITESCQHHERGFYEGRSFR